MEKLISYNPANHEAVGEVTIATTEAVETAVANAHNAQPTWAALSPDERVALLEDAARNASSHINDLATLLSREMGKDYNRAYGEVGGVINNTAYLAEEAKAAFAPVRHGDSVQYYRPLGVVAVISPWNYPLAMFNNLMIPALVAGNTVVLKPSEETPLIAHTYIELLNEILPKNVLQVVHGSKTTGQDLVDADVQMIAFTGSMAAGRDIMQRAAGGIKRLVMELGGNDPMIVLPDADVNYAANYGVGASLENSGQMCTAVERIYVHNSIKARFEQQAVQLASRYKVGAWNESGTQIFPIINEKQRQNIIHHIQDAIDKGAKVLLGGTEHPEHYITPTVLTDVPPDALMEQYETFGPVVSIVGFDDTEEAIRKANDSIYGLGASVYGGREAQAVAARLEAGMIGVNKPAGASPWVGAKQSGFGYHGSKDGHRQFAQLSVMN